MRHAFAALAFPLMLLACGGELTDPADDGSGAVDRHDAGAGTTPDAGEIVSTPDAATTPDAGPLRCPVPSSAHTGDMGTCATPDGTSHTFTSEADMLARLSGTWLSCGGFVNQPGDAIGMEFAGSQAFFLLKGANGDAVRGSGQAYQRTVTIVDDGSMNGPGAYEFQMDLTLADGSFDTYFVDSFDQPSKLVLNEGTSGNVAEYTPMCGATTVTDAGAHDAAVTDPASCSLVGTWDVSSNVPFGNLSSFLFTSAGTFVGGVRGAALPAGETFSGDWSITADGEVSIANTTGMLCNAGPTNMLVTYGADCASVTLQVDTDDCTGSREQLDDTTVMVRR
jgi:hypothetical protein